MAQFGENFRGQGGVAICPLCNNHLDNQAMSFQCPALKSLININCGITDIYKEDVTLEAAQTVTQIIKIREKLIEEKGS